MTDINELLAELVAALPPLFDPTRHVTAKIFSETGQLGVDAARNYLERLVKEGRLRRIEVRLETGQIGTAYERAE